ncbi:MAG: hypothetical protein AABW59_04355 [archaeon]
MSSEQDRDKNIPQIEAFLSKSVAKQQKEPKLKFDELQELLSSDQSLLREARRQMGGEHKGQAIVSFDPSLHKDAIATLVKIALESGSTPAIILTTLNYKSFYRLMQEKNIDYARLIVVDTISKNISKPIEAPNLFFIDSLRDLTQIQIKIVNIMDDYKDVCFVIDSLDVMELYHEDKIIYKFIYSLSKIIRKEKMSAFYMLNRKSLVSQLSQFVDSQMSLKG